MKKIVLIIISIILLVIDNTLLPFYFDKIGFPSLLFVFAISLSIIRSRNEALIIGIISGFLQDIFFFRGFGVNMLLNMVLCVLAAGIGMSIFRENRLIPVIACFILSLFKIIGVGIILKIFSENIDLSRSFMSAIWNAIAMLFIYKKVFNLSEKHFEQENWRKK